jgi:hypothetical protein
MIEARNVAVVLLLTAATLFLSAAPVEAGTSPPELTLANRPGGPYHDPLAVNLEPGEAKDRFAKVVNTYVAPNQMAFQGPAQVADFKLKYFKTNGNEKNITTVVTTGDGYIFTLAAAQDPGHARKFTVRAKLPANGDETGECTQLSAEVTTSPGTDVSANFILNPPAPCI